MNNRIKELADQCRERVFDYNAHEGESRYRYVLNEELFANLIIEECAIAAAVGWLKFCDEGVSATFPVGEVIMEHFGVE